MAQNMAHYPRESLLNSSIGWLGMTTILKVADGVLKLLSTTTIN